jgi:hypothetical protein
MLYEQVMCDADLKIVNCVAKWPGAVHDSRMLHESLIFTAFESNQKPVASFILGDSGYMLRDWLLTPILNTRTPKEEAYNTALCGTRCTVERCIGILKRRWHCLHTELRVAPKRACQIICACIVLHNHATDYDDLSSDYEDDDDDDDDDTSNPPPPVAAINQSVTERVRSAAGKATRDRLVQNYF